MRIERFNYLRFQDLLRIGREMHQESSYRHLAYEEEKLMEIGAACVHRPKEYLGISALEGDEIVGFFLGFIQQYFFSRQRIACDLILYVPRNKRGGIAAVRLIAEYQRWSMENGASQIMLGVSTGVNESRTVALYERLGFHHAGLILKKNV